MASTLMDSVLLTENTDLIFSSREKIFVKKMHLKPGDIKMRLFVIKAFRIHFF